MESKIRLSMLNKIRDEILKDLYSVYKSTREYELSLKVHFSPMVVFETRERELIKTPVVALCCFLGEDFIRIKVYDPIKKTYHYQHMDGCMDLYGLENLLNFTREYVKNQKLAK